MDEKLTEKKYVGGEITEIREENYENCPIWYLTSKESILKS